jgi:hypothetical protein
VLSKAQHVVDQRRSGAVAVEEKEEVGKALLDYVVHDLKGDLFPLLMEMMG